MNRQTFRLVLLVSCAHALVHVFELALPSVEQMIGDDFDVARNVTGSLGTVWRVPFGVGAFFAGWLADRFGSKPLLVIYLFGCATMALLAWWAPSLSLLFASMFAMGCFASIYHPAGLALIAHETTPENRGVALGWHGIFGSIGIAAAPFLAAVVFSIPGIGWRQYYLMLMVPAVVLGILIVRSLKEHHRHVDAAQPSATSNDDEETPRWRAFFLTVTVGTMQGFIYAGFMHFLPRYLGEAHLSLDFLTKLLPHRLSKLVSLALTDESSRNLLTALVLSCGIFGQAVTGRLAKPGRLEWQLSLIMFANAPFLAWMAVAQGASRLWATCLLALVHFMAQPVYNSLIAQYVPRSRRSVSYGFNNMLIFGIGGLAPLWSGWTPEAHWTEWTYGVLAGVAVLGGSLALVLWRPVRKNR